MLYIEGIYILYIGSRIHKNRNRFFGRSPIVACIFLMTSQKSVLNEVGVCLK